MFIVIEGVDKTGKTTLARELEQRTGGTYLHFGPPTSHPLIEYGLPLERLRPGQVVIADRFHLGERVWGPKLRGESRLSDVGLWWLNAALASRGGLIVMAVGEPEVVAERVRTLGDDMLSPDPIEIDELQCEFARQSAGAPPIQLCRFDFAFEADDGYGPPWHSPMTTAAQVLGAAAAVANSRWLWRRWPGLLAPDDTASWLFVGDGCNCYDKIRTLPFCPLPHTCGEFLLRALSQTGMLERSVAFLNAQQPDGTPEDLLAIWLALGRPNVVGLGARTSRRLRMNDVPHATSYHPHYMKQLFPEYLEAYGEGLVTAALHGEDFRPTWTQ